MNWQEKTGKQRDWYWLGWKIHYCYHRKTSALLADIPILLIHGFGASVGHWRHNIPVLKENHTVYAIDLLGFGASKKAYTDYDVSVWGELVYDFWRTFINVPVIVIGNSIGSLIALYSSALHPEMTAKLVMLSLPDLSARDKMLPSWALPIVTSLEKIVASPLLIRIIFLIVRNPAVIRQWLGVAYVDKTAVDDELIDIIATPPREEGACRTLIALSQSVNQTDFTLSAEELLQRVQVPMLLLWGKQDKFVPVEGAGRLAQCNPLITLQLLDNVGHCLHDENPSLFHGFLKDFLALTD